MNKVKQFTGLGLMFFGYFLLLFWFFMYLVFLMNTHGIWGVLLGIPLVPIGLPYVWFKSLVGGYFGFSIFLPLIFTSLIYLGTKILRKTKA